MLCRYVNRSILTHMPASVGTCRLWDLHLTEEELREDGPVWGVKISEDGSLLAVIRKRNIEMWKTSTWERLCTLSTSRLMAFKFSCSTEKQYMLRMFGMAMHLVKSILYLAQCTTMFTWSEERCGRKGRARGAGVRSRRMASIGSPKVIAGWAVEERMARRLINIPEEYAINSIKVYSGFVAIGHHANKLTLNRSILLIQIIRSNEVASRTEIGRAHV